MSIARLGSAALAAVLIAAAVHADGTPTRVALVRTPNHGIQPQAAVDAAGTLHLIYFKGEPRAGDVFYVRSTDGGAHFSQPLRVNSHAGSAIAAGNIRGAQLAVGKNGRAHVAWMGASHGKGSAHESPMLYARLNDAGTAFEPQRNVIREAFGLDGGGSVAADPEGNVYVAWHAPELGTKGEDARRVWVTRSRDEGKTFEREAHASAGGTGCCGCCGMRAFSDPRGNVFMLYRSAAGGSNRDTYLLASTDKGITFASSKVEPWSINACPMSSFSLAAAGDRVLAAWETNGQVSFSRVDPASGKPSEPVAAPGAGKNRKHPVVVGNDRGETLLVWTEGMGWNRGGSVVWQVYDKDGKPTAARGRADGVPTWSLVTAFVRRDGGFAIVY